jgi:hypothetical protein
MRIEEAFSMRIGVPYAVVTHVVGIVVSAGLPAAALGSAYDSLEVGAQYAVNTNRNEYHEFWDPGPGAELSMKTPFHTGNLWLGARYLDNPSTSAGTPDFQNFFFYAGWSYHVRLPWRIGLDPGFSLGIDAIVVEGEPNTGLRTETEVGGEFFLRASYFLNDDWRLNVNGITHETFTRRRIRLAFISVGVSRSFSMPSWMRRFLE